MPLMSNVRRLMLAERIAAFLNSGDTVVAEVVVEPQQSTRCFVRVRPLPKPGVPREERRYLNSSWSLWEYWDFEFRRLVLREGWKNDEWNYDRYIVEDQRRTANDPMSFEQALGEWVPSGAVFQHITESECPE
jgi:hypothetical protein